MPLLRVVSGLWMSALGVVGLALNLRVYDFVSQEIRTSEDPEFETFYTKNILLNEGIRAWMAAQDQPHENLIFPEEFYHVETLFNGTFSLAGVVIKMPVSPVLCLFLVSLLVALSGTTYPSEFYRPTGPEASQAQAFTFLVRDQRLGALLLSFINESGTYKSNGSSSPSEITFVFQCMLPISIFLPAGTSVLCVVDNELKSVSPPCHLKGKPEKGNFNSGKNNNNKNSLSSTISFFRYTALRAERMNRNISEYNGSFEEDMAIPFMASQATGQPPSEGVQPTPSLSYAKILQPTTQNPQKQSIPAIPIKPIIFHHGEPTVQWSLDETTTKEGDKEIEEVEIHDRNVDEHGDDQNQINSQVQGVDTSHKMPQAAELVSGETVKVPEIISKEDAGANPIVQQGDITVSTNPAGHENEKEAEKTDFNNVAEVLPDAPDCGDPQFAKRDSKNSNKKGKRKNSNNNNQEQSGAQEIDKTIPRNLRDNLLCLKLLFRLLLRVQGQEMKITNLQALIEMRNPPLKIFKILLGKGIYLRRK
ncbi:hypothetical protein FXO38_31910 [Capsicum annuum]|nr:hypothetical protein FXO38_31910 [Capsicum annuum]